VRITIASAELIGECKSRSGSFTSLYRWLSGNDFLAIKADRQEPLIVIEARKLASLLAQIPRQAIEKSLWWEKI
jgi:hypothetical protein